MAAVDLNESQPTLSSPVHQSHARIGRALEAITVAAMVIIDTHILLVLTGPNVADVRPAANITGADDVMSTRGELAFPVDFGERLNRLETQDGTRDAATGLPPVELGGPVQAQLSFWNPTTSQRVAWAIGELLAPTLTITGLWTVHQLVRSTRTADPFTTANEHRLWVLAGLIAMGGILHSVVAGFTTNVLIQRSAAADLFEITATISFLPLVLGLLIAMLALVWRMGTQMREDLAGTI